MPTYQYSCCNADIDVVRTIAKRDDDPPPCAVCKQPMKRRTIYSLRAKFPGRILQGGGPDRLTADVLGIPLKDLPAGLRTSRADLKHMETQPAAVDIRPIND